MTSRWLVVTATSSSAAITWGLVLVVGDAWISESREDPSVAVPCDEFMRSVSVPCGFNSVDWQVPGFIFNYAQMDTIHMGDLGTAQNCAGNVLCEIFCGAATEHDSSHEAFHARRCHSSG